jgi:hypothetical protein
MSIKRLNETLVFLANQLKDKQYCIRGTSSLTLQNIDMNVDDIDILCDSSTAILANTLLKDYLVDAVSYKENDKFKSYFGKFLINDIDVEFMGDWQIKQKDGNWSEVFDGSSFNTVTVDDTIVKVSKIEDELKMFLLMGRFNAYQKIKRQLPPVADDKQIGLFG